jgi:hypothetical protein
MFCTAPVCHGPLCSSLTGALQVDVIMRLLGLSHTRNTLVGSALTRQVAGRSLWSTGILRGACN